MNAQTLALLDLVTKGTVVLLLGFGITAILRRASAAHRSLAWLAVFAVLLALPPATGIKPVWPVQVVTAQRITPSSLPTAEITEPGSGAMINLPPAQPAARPSVPWTIIETWALLHALGFAFIVGFRVIGTWQLWRLKRGTSRSDAAISDLVAAQVAASGIHRPVVVLVSDRVTVPMTWGTFRPVILLPAECAHWDRADLLPALRHELAHVAHFDAGRRWLGTLACALWWPQPLVWLAARAWRLEQERACDDAVVRSGADPERYAEQLLDAARAVRLGGFQSAAALVMAMPSGLETRLRAVTDDSTDRSATGVASRIVASAFAVSLIAGCIAVAAHAADASDDTHQILVRAKFVEIKEGSRALDLPALKQIATGKAATIGDAAMEDLMRQLAQTKGVDILSAPSVTTKSGQGATVEIVREFFYPTEFEIYGKDSGKAKPAKSEATGTIVPITFDMKPVGVITELTPVWREGHGVEFSPFSARVNEFDGFVKCGIHDLEGDAKGVWRIKDGTIAAGGRPVLTNGSSAGKQTWLPMNQEKFTEATKKLAVKDGQVAVPVFSTHEWTGKPTLKPGEWHMVPLEFKSGEKALHAKRHLFCFVTAEEVRAAKPKPEPASGPRPKEPTLLQKARRIILPRVEIQGASITDAVELLRAKSLEFDPAKQGINIILRNEPPSTAEITLSLRDVPLNEALRYVNELAGMQVVWVDDSAFLRPVGEPEGMEMFTRVFAVPANLTSGETDAKKWLAVQSIAFPEGAEASFDRTTSKLTVKNVAKELRKVDAILQRRGIVTEPPKPPIVERAEKIIFPAVTFQNATLAEAVAFFRAKSRELDPGKRGVNIVLAGELSINPAKITLGLKQVPLTEALKYVAALAGVRLVPRENAFEIAPLLPEPPADEEPAKTKAGK